MQVGMIGLGRSANGLVRRLLRDGQECVVWDRNEPKIKALVDLGAVGASSKADFASKLTKPRAAWIMLPASATGATVQELAELCEADDIIIDGGNSYYRDDITRAEELSPKGIHYVDVGTSGGVFGLERGFCLMIGGEKEIVEHLDPIFRTLAPGEEAAPATPGRNGEGTAQHGYLHCGPAGAGHFVKMVHNGIEY